jgi:hypothetical protein
MKPNLQKIRREQGFLSITETATFADLTVEILRRYQGMGIVPRPSCQWYGSAKRYYTEDEASEIKRMFAENDFAVTMRRSNSTDERKAKNLWTNVEIMEAAGRSHTTWRHHVKHGRIPKPDKQYGTRLFYSAEQAKKIIQFLTSYQREPIMETTAYNETKSPWAWAKDKRCSVGYDTLLSRLRAGWDAERAISKAPINGRKRLNDAKP